MPRNRLSTSVDSYSKRPAIASKIADTDTAKPSTVQTNMNKRDPRLCAADSKTNEKSEVGLCVPRLTAGPPQATDLHASIVSSINDPDDPRSQLNFLASSSSKQSYDDFKYQPSFGPSDENDSSEEEENQSQEPKQPPSSLPVLKLPSLNTQLDTRYRDPRFGYIDSSANTAVAQNDPRLRKTDPRLTSSAPIDPRLRQSNSDPRMQQGPVDPRRQQQPVADPRLGQNHPRYVQSWNETQTQTLSDRQRPRFSHIQRDDSSKSRKKLTLSDYKKKANISKPETTFEMAPPEAIDVKNIQLPIDQPSSHPSIAKSHAPYEPLTFSQVISQQSNQLSSTSIPQTCHISSPEKQSDATVAKALDHPVTISPEHLAYIAPDPPEIISSVVEDDLVEETNDMAKTLNELSDPDDISQSPKQLEEPAVDDPVLADAMQKLVEHSGNVPLFTEALRSLQECAEEFGEQLTDPEFLVKKIAEKIEELSRVREEETIIEPKQVNIVKTTEVHEIHSPDPITSPDLSNYSNNNSAIPVNYIPFESVDMDIVKHETQSKSMLDVSMLKTLEELEKIEQKKTHTPKIRTSRNKFKQKGSKKESLHELDISDIPIPPEAPKPATPEVSKQLSENHKVILEETKFEIKPARKSTHNDDKKSEFKAIQPLSNIQVKKKSVISFNLKARNKSPETVLDLFKDDLDMRVKDNKTAKEAVSDAKKRTTDIEQSSFGLLDTNRTVSMRSVPSTSSDASEKKVNQSLAKVIDVFNSDGVDLDDRKLVNKEREVKVVDKQFVGKSEVPKPSANLSDPFVLGNEHNFVNKQIEDKCKDTKSSVNLSDPFWLRNEHKVVNKQIADKCKDTESSVNLSDPFGLGNEDIDERTITKETKSVQKKEVNDFGDIDWRPVTDVDMRSDDTSTENSQCSDLGDFDLRRSHSRSASPTPVSAVLKQDKTASVRQAVTTFVDPFGLDEDTDDQILSRSNSPLVSKENVESSKTKEITPDNNSCDSNSESGVLFDAYAIVKAKPSETVNEFGDIDWRRTAAAEMGDVDLRAGSLDPPAFIGAKDIGTATTTTVPVIAVATSVRDSDPFQQMNKNLKSMFSSSPSLPQYHTSVSSYDSYSTSPSKNICTTSQSKNTYESYSTAMSTMPGDYGTSSNQQSGFYNYATSGSQQDVQNQDGFQNIMQKLDFSNLKNILASVQQPQSGTSKHSESSQSETVEDEKVANNQKEEDDKPVFVTGKK